MKPESSQTPPAYRSCAVVARRVFALGLLVLAWPALGQSLPYGMFKALDECATELRRVPGVTAELKLAHTKPEDQRSFRLMLETPVGRRTIPVNKDGTFRLPEVPVAEREAARLTHSLEKGALTLSCYFLWNGRLPPGQETGEATLLKICSAVGTEFQKVDRAFATLEAMVPELKDFELSIVGVSLPRAGARSGRVLLKRGDETAAVISLSETGKAVWLFEDYDPRTHRVVWDLKRGEKPPELFMEFKMGPEATGQKRAYLVRKNRLE